MTIWSQTLVKNEEKYIWYALKSAVNFVDRMLVWDTGSTDRTVEIIEEFKKQHPKKIDFKEVGEVDPDSYTKMRQKMLEETDANWVMILDGDEVWWDDSLSEVTNLIKVKGRHLESIVTPYYNLVGDIYHFQSESAGRYEIDGEKGHLTIRFMNRKIPGLYTAKPHGQHGYFDGKGRLIQDRPSKKRVFLSNAHFMHFTHMLRSSDIESDKQVVKRSFKYKYELGKSFPKDFYYPEVFFRERPKVVKSTWFNYDDSYFIRAVALELPRKIKRIVDSQGSGY